MSAAAADGPCARCGAAGETAYSVTAQAVLCRRCYCRLPSAQYQPSSEPPVKLRSARKRPEPYAAFVCRIWDRLQERTGHTVFYLDATHIAASAPACLDGTVRIGYVSHAQADGVHRL